LEEFFAREGKAMNETAGNPVFVALLFILRCLVPLAILFGISYLFRRFGLVTTEAAEPPDERDDDEDDSSQENQKES
jgi:hypothetical protein